MKMAIRVGNDKFLAMTLKPVLGPIGLGNRPRRPKLWAIANENGSRK